MSLPWCLGSLKRKKLCPEYAVEKDERTGIIAAFFLCVAIPTRLLGSITLIAARAHPSNLHVSLQKSTLCLLQWASRPANAKQATHQQSFWGTDNAVSSLEVIPDASSASRESPQGHLQTGSGAGKGQARTSLDHSTALLEASVRRNEPTELRPQTQVRLDANSGMQEYDDGRLATFNAKQEQRRKQRNSEREEMYLEEIRHQQVRGDRYAERCRRAEEQIRQLQQQRRYDHAAYRRMITDLKKEHHSMARALGATEEDLDRMERGADFNPEVHEEEDDVTKNGAADNSNTVSPRALRRVRQLSCGCTLNLPCARLTKCPDNFTSTTSSS